jgi:ABC-type branched-subunit amino acid transport system substrate-binding protein
VLSYLNSQKIPDLFVASGCTCWNNVAKDPYTFGYQTDYTVEGAILGQQIVKAYPGKKIGYFAQNDDYGSDGVKGVDTKVAGSDVVSRQTYAVTNVNVAPQIQALQASGAQVVVSFSVPAFTALALLQAQKLNYHPTWVVSNVGADPVTLAGLLKTYSNGAAAASLTDGIVTDDYVVPTSATTDPWIALFKQVHDKYIPTLPFDGNVEFGMASAYTFVQTLLAAGQNPTRAGVVKALETTKLGGPGLVPLSYSPTNHQGYSGAQIGTISNGGLTLSGTPYTATDTGNIQPYTTPPPPPPANGIPTAAP